MKEMTPIKSITEELADCVAAFAEYPEAKWAWCCHHDLHVEDLFDPPQERINYILANKNECEQAIRFRNFRPIKDVSQPIMEIVFALNVLEEARNAHRETWNEYNAAWKAYNDARKAYDRACKVHKNTLVEQHNQEWSNNTWNGKNIFQVYKNI